MTMALPISDNRISVPADDAERFVRELPVGYGIPHQNTDIVARRFVAVDLHGVIYHYPISNWILFQPKVMQDFGLGRSVY